MSHIVIYHRYGDNDDLVTLIMSHISKAFGNLSIDIHSTGQPHISDWIPQMEQSTLREKLRYCKLLLILIGDDWTNAGYRQGPHAIDWANDIAQSTIVNVAGRASFTEKWILPVLINGGEMPDELTPNSILGLYEFPQTVSKSPDFDQDVSNLIETMKYFLGESAITPSVKFSPTTPTPQKNMGNSSTSSQVFLSYSRRDTQVMQRLRDDMQAANLGIWVDEDNLELGTSSWRRAIEKAIDDSSCIVVLLSPDAKKSEWVEAELGYAKSQKKPIYPILVRGDESNAVPFGYTFAQRIDIVQRDYKSELDKLIQALKKHLGM